MALLKESFGIYFCGIKYIYFLKEMDCVYISVYGVLGCREYFQEPIQTWG